jgi:SAM-dependent methyltransferase
MPRDAASDRHSEQLVRGSDLSRRGGSESFAVTLVSPSGYVHIQAFSEIAETVHYGLLALGYNSILTTRLDEPGRRAILLGAHLLNQGNADIGQPGPGSIIYNFEQVDPDSNWINRAYLDLLKRYSVWDYSQRNVELLKQSGVQDIEYVPVGWMPQLTRIAAAVPDIDVLFYGSTNERRLRILNELKARNVRVEHVFGVYGKERDALIARSKIVLNLHYYESKIFEIARVSYLLANGVCVVSENGLDPAERQLSDALAFAPYEKLVDTCLRLLSDEDGRARLAARGKQWMQSRREDGVLRQALESRKSSAEAHSAPANPREGGLKVPGVIPTVLNIGSGKDWKEEALNLDIEPEWGPDALYDLNQPLPPQGIELDTARFGRIRLNEDHFELIHAYDVLEHIRQLSAAMSTCLAWLKVGGVFRINVPYDLSWGAWQDPTHVRAFNERSWLYYTDWFWYLGWNRWRFDLVSLQYLLSPIGQKLHGQGTPADDLVRVPRAVDSMLLDLRKRPLTTEELGIVEARRRGARAQVLV